MRNIIMLTPEMNRILSQHEAKKGSDVVASSPWVQGDCEMPHRIVLRETSVDWICHEQVINIHDQIVYFSSGGYYPKSVINPEGVFTMAWLLFEGRCHRHLGLWRTGHNAATVTNRGA
jgi:hypothetical protein